MQSRHSITIIHSISFHIILFFFIASSTGCNGDPHSWDPSNPTAGYEDYTPNYYATDPGGKNATNKSLTGEVFGETAPGATKQLRLEFIAGNSSFRDNWNPAPASTVNRDGLGPFYNEKACGNCHFKDGRGNVPVPPNQQEPLKSMLIRISIPKTGPHGEELSQPDPIYGDQLEPFGVPLLSLKGEAHQYLTWETIKGKYADGTPYVLHKPTPHLDKFNYGQPLAKLYMSPRIAPQIIGMGLLQAIKRTDLEALADPNDRNGDGISGRMIVIPEHPEGKNLVGRFGWKAEQPTAAAQSAGAFFGDMGLTSIEHPTNNCPTNLTGGQTELLKIVGNFYSKLIPPTYLTTLSTGYNACHAAAYEVAGKTDVTDIQLNDMSSYVQLLAVPIRRNSRGSKGYPKSLRGERLFLAIGCGDCHHPSFITGGPADEDPQLKNNSIARTRSPLFNQRIFPYTDLLVHDMGEGLSDGRPAFYVGAATAREWRTPPLWGIGLIPKVNGHEQLLHDGRAQGVAEAILWHGGEAETAKDRFKQLSKADRDALVFFVNSI